MFGIDLAGGAWIFGAVLIVMLLATIYGLYTRTGSGINQRSYKKAYGDSPGAAAPSSLGSDRFSGQRYSRGTK